MKVRYHPGASPFPVPTKAAVELVFRIKADYLRALAHPVRLALIEELKGGERSVGQLVQSLGVEQSGISKHLAVLRQNGVDIGKRDYLGDIQ